MNHTKAALKAFTAAIPEEKLPQKIKRLGFGALFVALAVWLARAGITLMLADKGGGVWLVAGGGCLLFYGGHIISKDFSEAAKGFVLGIFKDVWQTVKGAPPA